MSDKPIRSYAAAGGVVVDPQLNRILVLVVPLRTTPEGAPETRLPKGHIEPGEGRAQAALREVMEETGLGDLRLLADLDHLSVEFDHEDHHVVRDESYFLMQLGSHEGWGEPEAKFERRWLPWGEAIDRLTYEPEREWVRRAREAWVTALRCPRRE
ncbi:MAG TPA: NUDIX domain-containing protein [Anaerolineae bacterium]|nr:NUDIX domain-containing protein [Anaerolineae bacterium]